MKILNFFSKKETIEPNTFVLKYTESKIIGYNYDLVFEGEYNDAEKFYNKYKDSKKLYLVNRYNVHEYVKSTLHWEKDSMLHGYPDGFVLIYKGKSKVDCEKFIESNKNKELYISEISFYEIGNEKLKVFYGIDKYKIISSGKEVTWNTQINNYLGKNTINANAKFVGYKIDKCPSIDEIMKGQTFGGLNSPCIKCGTRH